MLNFDYEDIDGMDTDEGDNEEPAPIGPWKATSSYDIYMVDTPKAGDGEEKTEDDPSKKQPKRRRQRRRSKSHHNKNGDSGTGDNNTPDSVEDNPLQQDPAQEDGDASPHERAVEEEVEDYMPPFGDEASNYHPRPLRLPPSREGLLLPPPALDRAGGGCRRHFLGCYYLRCRNLHSCCGGI